MTERPTLFNGDMVRAILEGRKTQTRRIVKPQPGSHPSDDGFINHRQPCEPGDVLYVRETWMPTFPVPVKYGPVRFQADGDRPEWKGLWKPSIHMPRWAARTFLRVESVKVERVQDISEEDAEKEGVGIFADGAGYSLKLKNGKRGPWCRHSQEIFEDLWKSCYPGSWERNDWVWAIQFSLIQNYNAEANNG